MRPEQDPDGQKPNMEGTDTTSHETEGILAVDRERTGTAGKGSGLDRMYMIYMYEILKHQKIIRLLDIKIS